jgi:hypothetical protein
MPIVHASSLEFNIPKDVLRASSQQVFSVPGLVKTFGSLPLANERTCSRSDTVGALLGSAEKESARSASGYFTGPNVATRDRESRLNEISV